MEPGKKKDTVQYSTARNVRSAFTVIWDASPASGGDITLSSGSVKGRYVATCAPAEGRWYQFFALGCCARMGDIVSQDRAYTIGVLLKLLEMYELEWQDKGFDTPLKSLSAVVFLLVTCLGGMRGYEAVWTDLAALRHDIQTAEAQDDESAVCWPIIGRFKAEHGVLGCYVIPIAGTTASGIQMFKWTQRFVTKLGLDGRVDGWAFARPDGSKARASDYKDDIFKKLEVIQSTTTLIDQECDIWDDYGVQRSGRRFFTTHATNMGVPPHIIELQARWSTDRANGVRSVKRTMLHLYSEMRNMKESLIRASQVM